MNTTKANIHPITQAFHAGEETFRACQTSQIQRLFAGEGGMPANPFGKPPKIRPTHDWENPTVNSLSYEWDRGYRNARKHARFRATIAARHQTA
jgi:hypothetical protein